MLLESIGKYSNIKLSESSQYLGIIKIKIWLIKFPFKNVKKIINNSNYKIN